MGDTLLSGATREELETEARLLHVKDWLDLAEAEHIKASQFLDEVENLYSTWCKETGYAFTVEWLSRAQGQSKKAQRLFEQRENEYAALRTKLKQLREERK